MSIQKKLYMGASSVAISVTLLLSYLIYSSRHIAAREKHFTTLESAVVSFSDLNLLMHRYVLSEAESDFDDRWVAQHQKTTQQLDFLGMPGIEKDTAERVHAEFLSTGNVFEELRGAHRRRLGGDAVALHEEKKLILDLLNRSEQVRSGLMRLLAQAHSHLHYAHTVRTVSSFSVLMILMGISVLLVFLMIVNGFNRRVRQMIYGTKVIGAGNLAYRLPEVGGTELGELARAFNRMAEDLKKTLVSRDALSHEIKQRAMAQEALAESEAKSRLILGMNPAPMWIFDAETLKFLEVNEAAIKKYGYSREEFLKLPITAIRPIEQLPMFFEALEEGRKDIGTYPKTHDWKHQIRDGTAIDVVVEACALKYDGRDARLVLVHDITSRKRSELMLKESEERFRSLSEAAFEVLILHKEGRVVEVNRAFYELFGYAPDEILGTDVFKIVAPSFRDWVMAKVRSGDEDPYEMQALKKDGTLLDVEVRARAIPYKGGIARVATFNDITQRKKTEEMLREREARLRLLLEQMPAIVWSTDSNARLNSVAGAGLAPLSRGGFSSAPTTLVEFLRANEPDSPSVSAQKRTLKGESASYEHEWDGRTYEVCLEPLRNAVGEIAGTIGVALDITERKQSERQLKQTAADLVRSNRELEQFAYVASHDLQEPLRMVASYMDLVARKYKGKLDTTADEFIGFAVDGARRMKQLIDDLLAYSRVGRVSKPFELVDSDHILRQVTSNLKLALEESGAEVNYCPLPQLYGDPLQLEQLFQNLISNAIKFRSEKRPRIDIQVTKDGDGWLFSVSDNGIGIEMQYADRIFLIFQRLHTLGEYPGTGIGLAICKKIVERHGGRIWVKSAFGQGSVFFFRLPDRIVLESHASGF